MKRHIDYIVIHCTAGGKNQSVESIQNHWRNVLGWSSPGYHAIVLADGEIAWLADFNAVTNGVRGYNHNSIHFSYTGGQFEDDRTEEQKAGLINCIQTALEWIGYPENSEVIIQGHRDFLTPGINWKDCPQFSAAPEYSWMTV